jgi:hypothetical protein
MQTRGDVLEDPDGLCKAARRCSGGCRKRSRVGSISPSGECLLPEQTGRPLQINAGVCADGSLRRLVAARVQ